MNITSLNFFWFFLFVLAVYYLLPRRFQNLWLLLVSYGFYTTWAWEFSFILLLLTSLNFWTASRIGQGKPHRQLLLWVGIGINASALLLFRVADFFAPDLNMFIESVLPQFGTQTLEVFLPIGMAFYTLQNIAYLVDVYRKQIPPSNNFVDFALFLAYFPKILSGPIERARTFLPKLAQPRRVDNLTLARGITLILHGLFRKLFVAGLLYAIIFWDAFESPEKYTAPELIAWILLYGMYLYNDFSGYTNIARGVSSLFGIELAQNFKQPYFARSISEFWNSWHISLSQWLRDYIFYPMNRFLLSKNRNPRSFINLVVPSLLTMLVSGFWHGLSWPMLLWGSLHGVYLAGERVLSLRSSSTPSNQQPVWRQVLSAVFVLMLVSIAWVPFVTGIPQAFGYWRGMLDWTYLTIRYRRILLAIPLFVLILLMDWLERHYQDEVVYLRLPSWARAFLLAASIFLLLFLMQDGQQEPFVYQGF